MNSSGIVEGCGVTTVYVTVVPISSTTIIAQLPNTPFVNYGGVTKPSSATTTAYGNYVYPIVTMKTQPTCSDDLVTGLETSVLNSPSISSAVSITSSQLVISTSTPPEVYEVETLTVIPLATLPTTSNSTEQTTTLTIQSTIFSATIVTLTDIAASTPVIVSIVYATGLPGTPSLISSSGSYPSSGLGGWNMSISSSSFSLSSSSLASLGTGISSTLAVDALSDAASATSSYSSESINFSNSYLLSNVTSTLVAQSISLLTALAPAQTTSEAAWTESYSEDELAASTTDAGQYTVMSMVETSSSSSSLPSFSSPLSFLNSTAMSGYTSSTSFSASSRITSQAGSVQSTSSGFSGPALSSFSSVSASASTTQLSSSSSSMTTTTFSTLATSFLPIVSSPANTTSCDLSTLSSSAPSFGANAGYSSWVSSATSSQLTWTITSDLTTSVLPSSASPTYPAEDTCTESITTSSSSPTSSILTFTTLISSVSPSTSSSTSLPVRPTACGEHGAFTLNVSATLFSNIIILTYLSLMTSHRWPLKITSPPNRCHSSAHITNSISLMDGQSFRHLQIHICHPRLHCLSSSSQILISL
jgi:trimeric autotransporter adhesin